MTPKTKKEAKNKEKDVQKKNSKKDMIDFEPTLEEAVSDLLGEDISLEGIEDIIEEYLLEIAPIEEAITVQQRIKKRQTMKRYRTRINIARKRQSKRRATSARLQTRARRGAVQKVKQKFARGRNVSKLSYGEKSRVERMASNRKKLISRTTRVLKRTKRAAETKRLTRRK